MSKNKDYAFKYVANFQIMQNGFKLAMATLNVTRTERIIKNKNGDMYLKISHALLNLDETEKLFQLNSDIKCRINSIREAVVIKDNEEVWLKQEFRDCTLYYVGIHSDCGDSSTLELIFKIGKIGEFVEVKQDVLQYVVKK